MKESGASGVIHKGNGVQIIYGPQVSVVKSNLEDFLDTAEADQIKNSTGKIEKTAVKNEVRPTVLYSPLSGKIVPLEQVEDEAFSEKVLGDGIAVEPVEGKLYAPCNGRIEMVFDTKHAVSLVSSTGCEILLHIGIDTVKLNGKYFQTHVSGGQSVQKGDLLISFDIKGIKSAGYKTTTPMIICNTESYTSVTAVASGRISAGEKILKIQ